MKKVVIIMSILILLATSSIVVAKTSSNSSSSIIYIIINKDGVVTIEPEGKEWKKLGFQEYNFGQVLEDEEILEDLLEKLLGENSLDEVEEEDEKISIMGLLSHNRKNIKVRKLEVDFYINLTSMTGDMETQLGTYSFSAEKISDNFIILSDFYYK